MRIGFFLSRLALCAVLVTLVLLALGGAALAQVDYLVNGTDNDRATPPQYISLRQILDLPLSGSAVIEVTGAGDGAAGSSDVPSDVTINSTGINIEVFRNNGTINTTGGGNVTVNSDNSGTILSKSFSGTVALSGDNFGTIITAGGAITGGVPTIELTTNSLGVFDLTGGQSVRLAYNQTDNTFHLGDVGNATSIRGGETLLGWDPSPAATTPRYTVDGNYDIPGNSTLYAIFGTAPTYTLTLDANGGTFFSGLPSYTTPSQSTNTFTLAGYPVLTPPFAGLTLLGWDEVHNAVNPRYHEGSTYTGAGPLFAIWGVATTYTLTLNANGGTFSGNLPSYTTAPQSTDAFTLTGYPALTPPTPSQTLLGWSESAASTTPTYAVGGGYTGLTSNDTLFAIWSAAPSSSDTGLSGFTLTTPGGTSYAGAINGTTVLVSVPYGTDVNTLVASYTLSDPLATASPDPSGNTSWANAFTFTVIAQDSSQQSYTVTVTVGNPPDNSNAVVDFTPVWDAERDSFQPGSMVVNCAEWVNVREGPGEEYAVIGRAYLHEPLQVISEQNGWTKCFYNDGNALGWIRSDFVGSR